jgi:catechol 2,3-dioxygenase-like lactoylglutathione lyase family enzyme
LLHDGRGERRRSEGGIPLIGHIGVNVPDLRAARAYYDELSPFIGFERAIDDDDQIAYRPGGGKPGTWLFFYPATEPSDYGRHRAGLQHLAFMVPTRAAVADAHSRAKALGSEILHAPRRWPEYPQPYYATFWLDPHGFMVEVVCHLDRN